MTPQVTVLLPVRDGARWLGEALQSVLAQTFGDWELVVVDDGSTDDTPRILAEFAQRDSRIRVIRQEPLGLVVALNRGLAEARGALLARLDADDVARPQRLEQQVSHFSRHPEAGLLGSWAERIDDAGRPKGLLKPETEPARLGRTLMRANPFVHSSVMFRTELARRLGGYRPAFRAAEDYDLWLRLAENATIANLPEVLIQYRWHGDNVTNRDAIRLAFSVRLAQRAARARQTGVDPAEGLVDAPDWRSPAADASFYASDAALYRMLELADPNSFREGRGDVDFAVLETRFDELSHDERALAAHAMINHMTRADPGSARDTRRRFLRLLWRRPGMVPKTAWRLLPAALLR